MTFGKICDIIIVKYKAFVSTQTVWRWQICSFNVLSVYYILLSANNRDRKVSGFMRKILCIILCLILCSATAVAQSYGHSDNSDYFQSQEYYDSHIHIPHGKVLDLVCNREAKTVSFKIDYFFDGEKVNKDVTFLIDKNTYIPEYEEGVSPNINALVSGEHKWISFFITPQNDEKINNMTYSESTIVHIDRIWDICKNVSVYPSPEEIQRNERLKNFGIMVGDENGNFNPYQCLTRAELTKIIVVTSNPDFMKEASFTGQSFSDAGPEHWAYPYIEYAKSNGIIDGYEDGTFKPENDVTIEELLKMAVSLLGYEPLAESTGGYPDGYIKTAVRLGLTENIAVEYNTHTIRTEAADIINAALDIPIMVSTGADEYVVCDGSAAEYPLCTLAIENFDD